MGYDMAKVRSHSRLENDIKVRISKLHAYLSAIAFYKTKRINGNCNLLQLVEPGEWCENKKHGVGVWRFINGKARPG